MPLRGSQETKKRYIVYPLFDICIPFDAFLSLFSTHSACPISSARQSVAHFPKKQTKKQKNNKEMQLICSKHTLTSAFATPVVVVVLAALPLLTLILLLLNVKHNLLKVRQPLVNIIISSCSSGGADPIYVVPCSSRPLVPKACKFSSAARIIAGKLPECNF